MSNPLGTFRKFSDLSDVEQQIVQLAWKGANNSKDHHLCFKSDFPVGAGILASNDMGRSKMFYGCNVDNDWFLMLWCPLARPMRQLPSFQAVIAETGMLDYWKVRGWPDLCQSTDNGFICS